MKSRVSRRGVLAATAGLVSAGGIRTSGQGTTNHIVVFGGSPQNVIEYGLTVSGRLEKTGDSGDAPIADRHVTIDDEDVVSSDGTHVSGAVAGGGDAYRFTGRIVRFRVSLPASRMTELAVHLNGRRASPTALGDNPVAETPIEFLDCTTARVTGTFRSVRMHTSFWDETGLGTNWLFDGPIRGTTTLHPRAEHEPYPFAIDSVSVDTRELQTPGQAAKFTANNPFAGPWCRERELPNQNEMPNGSLPHHLVIVGGSARNVVRYEFVVSGRVEKSGESGGAPIADRHVTIDPEDKISRRRVRGTVAGGGDAYRFSGAVERFLTGGGATVFLNGQRMNPDDLTMQEDNDEPAEDNDPMEDNEPSRGIEFFGCDRARVTGTFEKVAISTTWYAPDGVATSYAEIGPVSGKTEIDESNVGDVAGVAGFVITDIAAFESGAAEPTISRRHPNLDACLQAVQPADETTESETTEEQTTPEESESTTAETESESQQSETTTGQSEQTTAATEETPEQSEPTTHQSESTTNPAEETPTPAPDEPAPTEQPPETERPEPTTEAQSDPAESTPKPKTEASGGEEQGGNESE